MLPARLIATRKSVFLKKEFKKVMMQKRFLVQFYFYA
jgi:hypothetical protein